MKARRVGITVGAATLLASVPGVAWANAGLPMLALVWPGMGLALIPVVALEVYVLVRMLGTPVGRTSVVTIIGNAVTTVLGIPLTWAAMLAIQMLLGGGGVGPDIGTVAGKLFAVTIQAPWLLPYDAEVAWMLPAATLFLLVPFFFASWLIEYQVAWRMMRDLERSAVKRAVMWANLVSYGLLAAIVVGGWAFGLPGRLLG